MSEWFENGEFWTEWAPIMFEERRWAEVPGVIDGLERLAGFRSPMRVLDTCCGPGRHTTEFAIRGYRVTGVDITRSYLDAARESAEDEGVDPELVLADVRTFRRPASFDGVVNLFTSFGYFADPADDRRFVENVAASLVPGGRFVIELLGKEIEARDFIEGEWFERAGKTVMTEFSFVDGWSFLRNRWVIFDEAGKREYTFDRRLYSGTELSALLSTTGFTDIRLYGAFDGRPYDQKADTLIAVATKA